MLHEIKNSHSEPVKKNSSERSSREPHFDASATLYLVFFSQSQKEMQVNWKEVDSYVRTGREREEEIKLIS